MNFSARLVDWDEAVRRSVTGELPDDLLAASGEQPWLSEVDFEDSFSRFTAMGRAYECLKAHVSEGMRNLLTVSLDRFVREEPEPWYELPMALDPEHHFLALKPATVSSMADTLAALNLQELKSAYAQYCPEDVRADVGESPEEFTQWLAPWIDLFKEASQMRKGLIVSVS